jgi:hypothetical protein
MLHIAGSYQISLLVYLEPGHVLLSFVLALHIIGQSHVDKYAREVQASLPDLSREPVSLDRLQAIPIVVYRTPVLHTLALVT